MGHFGGHLGSHVGSHLGLPFPAVPDDGGIGSSHVGHHWGSHMGAHLGRTRGGAPPTPPTPEVVLNVVGGAHPARSRRRIPLILDPIEFQVMVSVEASSVVVSDSVATVDVIATVTTTRTKP